MCRLLGLGTLSGALAIALFCLTFIWLFVERLHNSGVENNNAVRLYKNEVIIAAICALLLSCALSCKLLFGPGWVGMRHDWTPTPFPGQFAAWASGERSGWLQLGMGEPSAYPNDWLILTLIQPFATVLPATALSKCILFTIPACLAFGFYLFSRFSLRAVVPAAAAGAIFSIANPFVLNKLASGQLAYLWALALLPLWFLTYRLARGRYFWPMALTAGLVAAVISSQIQFIVILLLIAFLDLVFWLDRKPREAFLAMLSSFGIIAIAQCATLASSTQVSALNSAATAAAPSIGWIAANSAPIDSTLTLTGYVVPYYENAQKYLGYPHWLSGIISCAVLVLLVWATIFVEPEKKKFFAGMTWLLGGFLASGIYAPGGTFIGLLYEHVRAMQAFRELYHWGAISAFGATSLLVLCVDDFVKLSKTMKMGMGILFLCVFVYGLPAITGNWGNQIQSIPADASLANVYNDFETANPFSRILWLPADQPLRFTGSLYAGLDPMMYSRPYSLGEYVPRRPVAAIITGLRFNNVVGVGDVLRYSGVGNVVLRKNMQSAIPEFSLRQYPIFEKSYAPAANSRGLASLGWPKVFDSDSISIFRSPDVGRIVDTAAAVALVSPSRPLLSLLDEQASPELEMLAKPSVVVLAANDYPASQALFCRQFTDLLKPGAVLQSGDANVAWTSIDGWWFLRDEFDRVWDTSLYTLAQKAVFDSEPVAAGKILMLSYVVSPIGGTMTVAAPGNQIIKLSTRSLSETGLRSIAFRVKEAGPVHIQNIIGQQSLRKFMEIDLPEWKNARRRLDATLASAQKVTFYIEGTANIPIPKTGMYSIDGLTAIDGRRLLGEKMLLTKGNLRVSSALPGGTLVWEKQRILPVDHLRDVKATSDGLSITGWLPPKAGIVVLRMNYAPGWHLFLDGKEADGHGVGDLFGNAWVFQPSSRYRQFFISYEPGEIIRLLHDVSFFILVIIATFTILLFWWFRIPRSQTLKGLK